MWGQGQDTFGGSVGDGGFMNSTFSSPSAPKGDRGARKAVNLFPVAIRQIHDSPTEVLKIENSEVNALTIVGIIRRVEISTTRISYIVDDQSGSIEALSYVGPEETGNAESQTILLEGTYGRIVGSLRTQRGSGEKYILIFKAFPISDMNEVTCHNLEVIQVPLKLKQLQELENSKTGVGFNRTGSGADGSFSNSMVGGGLGFGGSVGSKVSSSTAGLSAFNPLQTRIIAFIKADANTEGTSKDQIIAAMVGVPRELLCKTLEGLSSEGHIYSTVDDEHYMSTT